MKEEKPEIDESIKFGYFYSSGTKVTNFLLGRGNVNCINLHDSKLDWNELRNRIDLSDFSFIFLDGGNKPSIKGIDLMGDDVADYVEKGGVVCTLGASHLEDCMYNIKGRWLNKGYQPVKGEYLKAI